jgi:hypothetical protein
MKNASKVLLLTATLAASALSAQEVPEFEGQRLSVNIFRAPSTGLDYRFSDHASVHAGHYPTVLSINGDNTNVNFVRLGGTFWLSTGSGPYLSTGVAFSMEPSVWDHSIANEAGYHQRLGSRVSARLGAILLSTTDFERTRLNPTIGLSVRLGSRRTP